MSVHHYELTLMGRKWVWFCHRCRDSFPATTAEKRQWGVS